MSKHEIMNDSEKLKIQAKLGAGEKVTIQGDKVVLEYDDYDAMIDALINDVEGNIVISSRGVADMFDMEHFHLIRDIEGNFTDDNLICQSVPIHSGIGLDQTTEFWETAYKDANNQARKQYLMSSDGFIMLMAIVPRAKDKRVRKMRLNIQIRIVKRMRLLQETLMLTFSDTIKNHREFGKMARRNLTDQIKYKLKEFGGKEKDVGQVYAIITLHIYDFLNIPQSKRSNKRDSFDNTLLLLIQTCETLVSAFISQHKMKRFNIKQAKILRPHIMKMFHEHLDETSVAELLLEHSDSIKITNF